jgi:NitT/TauT family transport system substrate-binding protein
MPATGPTVIMAISKLAGVITGPVDLSTTYTNSFADTANKLLGFTTG